MKDHNKNSRSGKGNFWHGIATVFSSTNQLVRTLVLLALVALVAIGLGKWQHRGEHKKISRTITQRVTEIKKIHEFCTANYCEETVVSATRKKMIGSDDIAIIVKGTVRVGFDLADMQTEVVNDTTINIILPKPKVLDVITNPSDCETFEETGHWSHKQVVRYKNIARSRILRHAQADGIMHDAEENGIERLQLLFTAMGFKVCNITIEE